MTPFDASEVAKLLAEYGRRTALAGGNPYRSKAYLRAAESLLALAEPLDRIVAEGRLREIPGTGEAIADIITRLHRTGTHPSLERMRSEIPEGVLEMLSVPGLRPDKVLKLHKQLGVTSLEELQAAAIVRPSSSPRRKRICGARCPASSASSRREIFAGAAS
jgi:DNA polymerase (family X)